MKTIVVGGEPGGGIAAVRERIASLWKGAKVRDHHGMTEVGPVSFESPAHEGVLHAIESSYLVESVDPDTGAAVAEGEEGELVLTTLGRLGSPLLRYRTGDRVRLDRSGASRFGRNEVALLGGILGRIDDMVIVRGVNIHPLAIDEIVRECEGIAEYRAEIRGSQSMTELSVIVEPKPEVGDRDSLSKRLGTAFRTAFNFRIPVTVVSPGDLPRFEMKAKRWIRV